MAQTPTIPEIKKRTRPRSRRFWIEAVFGAAVLIAFIASALYLTGAGFRDKVRRAVVTQLEDATGGTVEIRSFQWNLAGLDVEIDGLTIHGREGVGELPYLHVDHLSLRAKVLAVLERRVGLRYVGVTRPTLHIIVYPDGSTNQPAPRAHGGSRDAVQSVFDLAINRADVNEGVLILNDRKLPFALHASDFVAGLTKPHRGVSEYDLHLQVKALGVQPAATEALRASLQLDAAVHPSGATIQMLRVSSGGSSVEAHGTVRDLRDPQIALEFKGRADAGQLARLASSPALRSGILDVRGKFSLHGADYSAVGDLATHDLRYADPILDLGPVDGSGSFSVDASAVRLTRIDARVWAGRVTGDVSVSDWLRPERKAAASLQLGGLPLRAIMQAGRYTKQSPASLDASVSGSAQVRWEHDPSQCEVKLDLALAQPATATPGLQPVAGVLQGTYSGRSRSIDLDALELHTASTQVDASGRLGVRGVPSARLRFSLFTRNLDEVSPFLDLAHVKLPPVRLQGMVSLDGSMDGSLDFPRVRSHLVAEDFQVENPADVWRPSGATQLKPVHVDSALADLEYTRTTLNVTNGSIRRDSMQVAVAGSLQLGRMEHRNFVEYAAKAMPISAHVSVHDASVGELQQLLGIPYVSVTGNLDSTMQFSGTAEHLNASGDGHIAHGSIYGEAFHEARAHLDMQSDAVRVTRLSVAQDGGTITGDGTFDLPSRRFQLTLRGDGFELAHFNWLQPGHAKLAGKMSFEADGAGTLDAPSINAHARIANARMEAEPLGNIVLDGVTHGEMLHLTGSTSNRIANLQLTGEVRLRDRFPATLHAKLNDFDIDPLLKLYARGRVTGHSRTVGTVDAIGPLRDSRRMVAKGDIETVRISVENFALNNRNPIHFEVRDQVLRVQQFQLIGEGTDFALGGTVGLASEHRIDGSVNGAVNVQLLRSFNPRLTASGIADVRASAQGTLERPSLTGEIDLHNVNVATLDLPNGLSNMNGRMVFSQDRLLIQQVTAQTGGGTVNLGGFVGARSGLYFDITAAGRDIRIRQQGISASADADLRLNGTLTASTLSGEAVLNRFSVGTNFDFGNLLLRSKQGTAAEDPQSIANHVRLNIRVTSAPQLAVETSLARLSGDVDLNVRGTALNPVILGRVNVAEGDVQFQGTRYHIDRADVTFTNPVRIEPVLNVEASTTVRSYDITLGFHGPVDHLQTNYRSEPPLPTADIISLLAFQRTTEEAANSQQQTTFTESAQNAVLGEALNAAVSSRIQKLFGISKVKIDPQGGGLENNKPSITVEQQVHQNLTVTFVTYPTQSNQQLIQVEYNINKNVSIVGVRDQYGVLGIDVRLRQRKR